METTSIKAIGIIGLGLIGGSIAKALRVKSPNIRITAFGRKDEPLKKAFLEGVINEYSTSNLNIFKDCGVIFICTPVDEIVKYAKELSKIISPGCILTDVGSTKAQIMDKISACKGVCFIGGHPMAGSEKTGYDAAKSFLFENAYYIFTPSPDTSRKQLNIMTSLAETIGAIPIIMQPKLHDYSVAAISHLPHIIAASLVSTVKSADSPEFKMQLLAAGGFKDITRIASGSPDIWRSICESNKAPLLVMLENFKNQLMLFEQSLNTGGDNLYDFLKNAKDYRDGFTNKSNALLNRLYEIKVDVEDKPGIIAKIATILSENHINIKNIGIINNREYESGVLQVVLDSEDSMHKSISLLKNIGYTIYN